MSKSTEEKQKEMEAVRNNDLKIMLKQFGMWRDYKKGTLKCHCGNVVSREKDNLEGFVKKDGKVYPACHVLCWTDW